MILIFYYKIGKNMKLIQLVQIIIMKIKDNMKKLMNIKIL